MDQWISITGMGCISSIGNSVFANWNALESKKHGIAPIQILDSLHRSNLLAGEVLLSNADLCKELGFSLENAHTRTELLATMAIREIFESCKLDLNDNLKTGFINSTTVGGMDSTERYFNEYLQSYLHRDYILHHSSGYITQQIAKTFGLKNFTTTISTACSSAANAIMLGARMIRAGILDRVLVGGVDSLSKFTVNGFHSLRIYSDGLAKPFDENRNGLNLGEAAGFLLLESQKSQDISKNPSLAYLSGYGNSNDAFHQTASSDHGDGALAAMQKALLVANLEPARIDYINVHGTATPNNDLSEGRALLKLYGDKNLIPPFSSTKPFTGHTLAAAGSVEAIFSVLALQNQKLLPSLNFEQSIAEIGLTPQLTLESAKINHVLSNSLGFGGNCSTLIFSKA